MRADVIPQPPTVEEDVDYAVLARKAGLTPWHGELLLQLDRIATALEGGTRA